MRWRWGPGAPWLRVPGERTKVPSLDGVRSTVARTGAALGGARFITPACPPLHRFRLPDRIAVGPISDKLSEYGYSTLRRCRLAGAGSAMAQSSRGAKEMAQRWQAQHV